MAREQTLGLRTTILHREQGWDPEGIKAVDIAACRQNFRRAQQITARCRANEFAIKRAQQSASFGFLHQQRVGVREAVPLLKRRSVCCKRLSACAIDKLFERLTIWREAMARFSNRREKINAFFAIGRFANNMKPMRDQGCFKLIDCARKISSLLVPLGPSRLSFGQIKGRGLRLHQFDRRSALMHIIGRQRAPAFER